MLEPNSLALPSERKRIVRGERVRCLLAGTTKQQALKIADKLGFNESTQLLEQTATQIMNIY